MFLMSTHLFNKRSRRIFQSFSNLQPSPHKTHDKPPIVLKMHHVFINTKTKPSRLSKSQHARFRIDKTHSINAIQQSHLRNTTSQPSDQFQSPEYREFLSLLPYEIMVKSKEKISLKLAQKTKAKNICPKVLSYLKKYHKPSQSSKSKLMDLKMKNIAAKQINIKDLNNIYTDMSSNRSKKQFQRSLLGNWFKQDNSVIEQTVQEPIFSKTAPESEQLKKLQSSKSISRINSGKSKNHFISLKKKFNETKKKLSTEKPHSTDYEKKVNFNQSNIKNVDDNESEEEYLCNDDMGIINKFVQNSHNYQKQISYLINSSQLEDTYRQSKKSKLKTPCKTQTNNSLFSHTIISEIMKKMFMGGSNGKMLNLQPHESSNQLQKDSSICPSVRNSHQISHFQIEVDQNVSNKENMVPSILSLIAPSKIKLPTSNNESEMILKNEEHKGASKSIKSNKGNSPTNHSQSEPLSFKHSTLNTNHQSKGCERRTYTEISCETKELSCVNRGSTSIKQKRPMTAGYAWKDRTQCKSLFFNQWIETEPCKGLSYKQNINFTPGTPQYDFCQRNVSNGDNKIWVKTKKGKIVRKTISSRKNQNYSAHFSKRPQKNS